MKKLIDGLINRLELTNEVLMNFAQKNDTLEVNGEDTLAKGRQHTTPTING